MKNLVIYENFGNLQITNSEKRLSAFDEACLEEGIEFDQSGLLSEDILDEFQEESDLNEKGKFGQFLKKAFKTVGPLIKNSALTFLKNSGLPMGGAIAGIIDKVTSGIGKIKELKGTKSKDFQEATKGNPELSQVSQVAQKTLDKLSADLKQRGTGSLFDPQNRESLGNLFAIYNATHTAKTETKKGASAPATSGKA